jgi:hypothetical protein
VSGNPLQVALSAFLSPLKALLLVVAVLSACGGAIGTCMGFITKEAFGLGDRQNLTLQLVAGLIYVVTALGVGPLLRRGAKQWGWLSTQRVLVGLLVVWAGAYLVEGWSGQFEPAGFGQGAASGSLRPGVLLFALGYCLSFAASGATWPIIQSYISGGKAGSRLRQAIGEFNMTWSAAIPIGVFGLGAVVQVAPLESMLVAGLLVLLCVIPLRFVAPEPGTLGEAPEPVRPIYHPLLACFRAMLPMGVLLAFVLYPIAPTLTAGLGLTATTGAVSFAAMHLFRFLIFLLMRYWHGWHGRWRTVVWSSALLFGGFTAILLAPNVWVFLLGLSAFGAATGAIYYAALYYGLAVGNAEVEAGGKHEALIGCGFIFGPLAALLPYWLGVDEGSRQTAILLSSLLVCAAASYWVFQPMLAWRRREQG